MAGLLRLDIAFFAAVIVQGVGSSVLAAAAAAVTVSEVSGWQMQRKDRGDQRHHHHHHHDHHDACNAFAALDFRSIAAERGWLFQGGALARRG